MNGFVDIFCALLALRDLCSEVSLYCQKEETHLQLSQARAGTSLINGKAEAQLRFDRYRKYSSFK